MDRTWVLATTAMWPWPWRYDLWLMTRQAHGSWTTIVLNIIQIQNLNMEWWPLTWVLARFSLWPWPLRYYIGSKSWQSLWPVTTVLCYIGISISHVVTRRQVSWYDTQADYADSSVHKSKSFINTTYSPNLTLLAFNTNKKSYLYSIYI